MQTKNKFLLNTLHECLKEPSGSDGISEEPIDYMFV